MPTTFDQLAKGAEFLVRVPVLEESCLMHYRKIGPHRARSIYTGRYEDIDPQTIVTKIPERRKRVESTNVDAQQRNI